MIAVKQAVRRRKTEKQGKTQRQELMGRLAKLIVILIVLGAIAFVGYAYWPGTLKPREQTVEQPVTLDAK